MTGSEKFAVAIDQDEPSVCVRGTASLHVLLRVVLAAKFSTEPNADILLSPYVNKLVDELVAALKAETKVDWDNPAILTPPEFIRAADEVRRFQSVHAPTADLEALLADAMKPHSVPPLRLKPAERGGIDDTVLDRLEGLHRSATPAPWFVRHLDDVHAMSAVAVSTAPGTGGESMRSGSWPTGEIVAATLLQEPAYVSPSDDRWDENAALIAECRTLLPELVRLARLGLQAERA